MSRLQVSTAALPGRAARAALLLCAAVLAACGLTPARDGAPPRKLDPASIPDAVPKRESVTAAGNKSPYTVLGHTYVVLPSAKGYHATGIASWYGTKFDGKSTANGDEYDLYGMTAAHKTLPIPTYVLVTNLENGRQAIVRVNDRGPFVSNRLIDLSYAAAVKLGYAAKGTALVEVAAIDVDNWPPRKPALLPEPVTPPLAPPRTEPVAGVRSAFFVQVGAYASRASADALRARVADRLQRSVAVQPSASSPVLYRVRIGPFDSRADADRVRATVLSQHISEAAQVIDESAADH